MNLRNVAISTLLTVTLLTALILTLLPTVQTNSYANRLLIENIHYVQANEAIGPVDILIEQGRISNIRHNSDATVALNNHDATATIDGTGLYALPGLIDAHTHSYGSSLEGSLKYGVTTSLDMAAHVEYLAQMKKGRDDYVITDRSDLFSAGMAATAANGHGTQFGMPIDPLETPADADAWVEARIKEGSDYIKIIYMPNQTSFASIDLATSKAIIQAAHKRNKLAVAHIHTQSGARELLEANVDGFVHMFADTPVTPEFIQLAKAKEVFFVPTLAVLASASGRHNGKSLIENPKIKPYLSAEQKMQLAQKFDDSFDFHTWQLAFENTYALANAGVPILAGSDAPNPGTTAGVSLHHEMALLVEAGLSNAAVLDAATILPAHQFNLENRGRIQVGARADVLLLERSPLENIEATLHIRHIIKNGQPLVRD